MSDESAEQIAAVVADIRAGRVEHPAGFDEPGIVTSLKSLQRAQLPQPVVDCTAILAAQQKNPTVSLYDDFPSITPPWQDAMLCYVNSFGNVIVLQVHRDDWDGTPHGDWYTQNDVNWPVVRWVAETDVWIGGKNGKGNLMPTSGPCHRFRHAITQDGAPATSSPP